jgi:hypothetical protein
VKAVAVTEAQSRGSEKVAEMTALTATSVAPLVGLVEETVGAVVSAAAPLPLLHEAARTVIERSRLLLSSTLGFM